MPSVFPVLFDFSLIGVAIIRIVAGVFFLVFGSRLLQVVFAVSEKHASVRFVGFLYAITKLLIGLSLSFGIFTQIGALVGAGVSVLTLFQDTAGQAHRTAQQVQILLFVICLSLLFLGPGLYAVDYPL